MLYSGKWLVIIIGVMTYYLTDEAFLCLHAIGEVERSIVKDIITEKILSTYGNLKQTYEFVEKYNKLWKCLDIKKEVGKHLGGLGSPVRNLFDAVEDFIEKRWRVTDEQLQGFYVFKKKLQESLEDKYNFMVSNAIECTYVLLVTRYDNFWKAVCDEVVSGSGDEQIFNNVYNFYKETCKNLSKKTIEAVKVIETYSIITETIRKHLIMYLYGLVNNKYNEEINAFISEYLMDHNTDVVFPFQGEVFSFTAELKNLFLIPEQKFYSFDK